MFPGTSFLLICPLLPSLSCLLWTSNNIQPLYTRAKVTSLKSLHHVFFFSVILNIENLIRFEHSRINIPDFMFYSFYEILLQLSFSSVHPYVNNYYSIIQLYRIIFFQFFPLLNPMAVQSLSQSNLSQHLPFIASLSPTPNRKTKD